MRRARPARGDAIQYLLAESQLLRDAGKTGEAFELLDNSLKEQPEQPELLYESALLAEKLGHHDVLEAYLRKLIRIKPEHAHAYNALGYSFAERNQRLAEAEQLIVKALQLSPDDPFIIDSMGWVLYRKGDSAGALTHLQRAFSIRPDPEIAAHLGEVLWALGRRDEARKTWQEAVKANPDNAVLAEVIKRFSP
ncbi:MAG: tetratricopeptide repeat protein [Rhodocyclaceae bacterium]|nr:tetratricopeptide repeat protein [Rhodocyclaceae bacterium]